MKVGGQKQFPWDVLDKSVVCIYACIGTPEMWFPTGMFEFTTYTAQLKVCVHSRLGEFDYPSLPRSSGRGLIEHVE